MWDCAAAVFLSFYFICKNLNIPQNHHFTIGLEHEQPTYSPLTHIKPASRHLQNVSLQLN